MAVADIIAGSAVIKLALALDNMSSDLDAVRRTIDSAAASWGEKFKSVGKSIMGVGATMTAVGGIILKPIEDAVQEYAKLEESLNRMQAASGDSAEAIAKFETLARNLAKTYSVTATEIVDAMTVLSKAGLPTDEIEKGIEVVLKLGSVAQMSSEEVGESLVKIGSQFKISAAEWKDVGDILKAVDDASVTSIAELVEGLKNASGAYTTLYGTGKDSMSELTQLLGALAEQGMSGAEAGTSLNRAFTQLSNTGAQLYLEKLGVAVTDANNKALPFIDIVRSLKTRFEELKTPELEQISVINKLFNTYGAKSVFKLMSADVEKFNEAVENGTEGLDKAAEVIKKGYSSQLSVLHNQITDIYYSVGKALLPALVKLLEAARPMIEAVADWIEKNPELTLTIAAVGAALVGAGGLLIAIGAITAAIGTIITTVSAVVGLIGGAAAAGTLIAAIVAVVASLGLLAKSVYENSEVFTDLWEGIKSGLAWLEQAMKDMLVWMGADLGELKKQWSGTLDATKEAVKIFWVELKNQFEILGKWFVAFWDACFGRFGASWKNTCEYFYNFGAEYWARLKRLFDFSGLFGSASKSIDDINKKFTDATLDATKKIDVEINSPEKVDFELNGKLNIDDKKFQNFVDGLKDLSKLNIYLQKFDISKLLTIEEKSEKHLAKIAAWRPGAFAM